MDLKTAGKKCINHKFNDDVEKKLQNKIPNHMQHNMMNMLLPGVANFSPIFSCVSFVNLCICGILV